MTPTREQIAAYADGELEGETLRAVEAAVTGDPDLQAQLAAHRRLKARLTAHFEPVAAAPVPERLLDMVRQGSPDNVVNLAAARERANAPRPRFRWAGPALAASLLVGLVGYGVRQQAGGHYAAGEIAGALDSQLVATQPRGAQVRILLSFRDGAGRFCRGFSSPAQSGVACRDGRGWKLDKVIGGQEAQSGEYRQAGSADADVLSAIQDLAQGPALDAEGERKAMRAGWRRTD